MKIDKWPDLSYSFLPIDCCVRINGKPIIYSVIIFSHRYLGSNHINTKTCVPGCYRSIWTSSYNTDIKANFFFNGVSTMLNNVFKVLPRAEWPIGWRLSVLITLGCRGWVVQTTDFHTRGPRFKSQPSVCALRQGTLSSLPSPLEKTQSCWSPGCLIVSS